MKIYKICLLFGVLLVASIFTYVSFMYVYTDHMFAPIVPLEPPHTEFSSQGWKAPLTPFIHKVNTPERAHRKEKKFNGFEVDVLSYQGNLLAAHDPTEATRNISLADIFATVKHPQQKIWWLDVKGELTDAEIEDILQLAKQYAIPTEHLLFEVSPGPTAKRIKQKHLSHLLPLPDGFDQDQNNPAVRAQLNATLLALLEEYQPQAISASFGKYAYLKTYFPNAPKAIYYSATQRPSIKKLFMRQHMEKDPSVKIFMTDEYNWVNL